MEFKSHAKNLFLLITGACLAGALVGTAFYFFKNPPSPSAAPLDCHHPNHEMSPACQARLPCDQQDELVMTDECVRTYKCPPAAAPSPGLTLVGVFFEGKLKGTVALSQKGAFEKISPDGFSGIQEIYFKPGGTPSHISYQVSYDATESGLCYFSYTFDPPAPTEPLFLGLSRGDPNHPTEIHGPSPEELALFGKSHALCKKKRCLEDTEWNLSTLYAVTDLNGDGLKEYWHTYADGYREWNKAEEYDPKTGAWNVVFGF